MRRITMWIVSTVSALVLLFAYHTSTGSGSAQAQSAALAPTTPGAASTATTPTATASPAPSSSASSKSSSATSKSTGTSGSYTGSSVDTQWGPVQVKITVANGKITDVQAVVYPDGNGRDEEINAYALPVLHDEVIKAQNAQIDAVGGATVTSDGYITSLQSALDAANLKS